MDLGKYVKKILAITNLQTIHLPENEEIPLAFYHEQSEYFILNHHLPEGDYLVQIIGEENELNLSLNGKVMATCYHI